MKSECTLNTAPHLIMANQYRSISFTHSGQRYLRSRYNPKSMHEPKIGNSHASSVVIFSSRISSSPSESPPFSSLYLCRWRYDNDPIDPQYMDVHASARTPP